MVGQVTATLLTPAKSHTKGTIYAAAGTIVKVIRISGDAVICEHKERFSVSIDKLKINEDEGNNTTNPAGI